MYLMVEGAVRAVRVIVGGMGRLGGLGVVRLVGVVRRVGQVRLVGRDSY